MRQSSALIAALKSALRSRRVTYRAVAEQLGLSEASVKRMFSTGNFTLQRLEQICGTLEMTFTDLVELMEERRQRITHLTEAQERELVANIKLLLVAVCARNHWSFEEILAHYDLAEPECIGLLARLDRLKLIELQPNNRIRLIVARDFRWISNGPIERYFAKRVQQEFLNAGFKGEKEKRLFLSGPLADSSVEILLRRLEAVAVEFQELLKSDAKLPISERRNVGMGLTLRHWELAAFGGLRRMP